ncbi:MAG TPA: hypothetical protein VNR42_05005 [Solirubrobacteraceae bacterium]|nr:hypothetical protein [Solirubrobacteraceae bacterium]
MVSTVRAHLSATRASTALLLAAALVGCGTSTKGGPTAKATTALTSGDCPTTVLRTVGHVLERVYREGVSSERTAVAKHLIEASVPLRAAVERGNAPAVSAAAHTLLKSGHMTNLRIARAGRTLADLGSAALAPLQGTLTGAGGTPIATYTTSVWADRGFLDEARGVAEGLISLRAGGRSVGGSLELPAGSLPNEGTIARGRASYRYTSFPAESFPSGSLRVYVLRTVASTTPLCGRTSEDTLVNTLHHVANLIYAAETGARRQEQVKRVQGYRPLLEAVARRNPTATEAAIHVLLHQHVVRMRVSAGGRLLADVGGPYVLAPVTAPLRLHGRTVGSVELSIQDDEGYKRLAGRLAGLRVLMYMNASHPTLVKNSLGPEPGAVPAGGLYQYRGSTFHVFTVHAQAFPSGPLTIRVLVPIPYS